MSHVWAVGKAASAAPVELTSFPLAGIVLAMLSAAVLSVANLLQARGVGTSTSPATSALGAREIRRMLRSIPWLIGAALFGVAILLQIAALAFAPLIVVQPIGVIALVFAALLTVATTRRPPSRREVTSIVVCVVGVGIFVTVAALVSSQKPITDAQLIAILVVLAVVLAVAAVLWLVRRGRGLRGVELVLLGGVFSGFVATLGKTVILRVQTVLASLDFAFDSANVLTIGCVVGIAVAGVLSIYLVQAAHVSNRPEVVVAGLTVVDPFVAVVLGITILGEAAGAPPWAFVVFAVTGAIAIAGVIALSRAEATHSAPPQDR
jgi:drug/metabolite transporter (DMT)-like permease